MEKHGGGGGDAANRERQTPAMVDLGASESPQSLMKDKCSRATNSLSSCRTTSHIELGCTSKRRSEGPEPSSVPPCSWDGTSKMLQATLPGPFFPELCPPTDGLQL